MSGVLDIQSVGGRKIVARLSFHEDERVSTLHATLSFCSYLKAATLGTGLERPFVLVIDGSAIPSRLLGFKHLPIVIETYKSIYEQLKERVHSTVVILQSTVMRTIMDAVLTTKRETATEVVSVASESEAQAAIQKIVQEKLTD